MYLHGQATGKPQHMIYSGEKTAWDILSGLDPKDVSKNAEAIFNPHDSSYELTCFGQDIRVSLPDRFIFSRTAPGKFLVNSLGKYSSLSILRYLIHAIELPISGKLVHPSDFSGGDIFMRGTHVLPLDELAAYFTNNSSEFINTGKSLGGFQLGYGDMSLKLFPFPRLSVVIIVWSGNEEFAPKSSLLFDSRRASPLPTDILWSTAMMAVKMMLINSIANR